ncbi:glycoside hydrolase family 3 protein [Actinomadura craniellae]|uniref:Glycoside hydrolase family 3 protein n=2 Tax=Actinomadura craniellae TaxID=2231787 RepID=A0A365GYU4_9ACTN|nr:glycoside hydrolase family 3 N-terminal domain-containing protein [Actinomadura craniellae]RAY12010.1 glycoside hydrolase family 3 protein [Actinomadura craniellae]
MTDEISRLARATLLPAFSGATAPRWLLDELDRGLAGVTLFAINGNVPGAEELAALTRELRRDADPVIAIDEEGGDVTRLGHLTGSPYPGNAALGAADDTDLTRRVYRSLGAELAAAGVGLDFAPSVDVNTAADNPIVGTRSFGADPALVARHAAAAVQGMQEAGVAACAKHFPGHGATVVDSHLAVPAIEADLALLERRELVPFRAAIEAGVQSVMTGHLALPSLTGDEPATLSHAAITGLLRDHLGYQGVIVTDALDMKGASGDIGLPEASVRALRAGADLLCLGSREYGASVQAIVDAVVAAVRSGRLPHERLADAAARARRLTFRPSGTTADRALGLAAARRALRATGRPAVPSPALVVELEAPGNIAVGPVPWGLGGWTGDGTDVVRVAGAEADPAALLERATGRGLVVVVRDAHRHPDQRKLTETLLAARPEAVIVEMGLPIWRPEGAAHLATYGASSANARAAAEFLGLIRTPG